MLAPRQTQCQEMNGDPVSPAAAEARERAEQQARQQAAAQRLSAALAEVVGVQSAGGSSVERLLLEHLVLAGGAVLAMFS